jgi:hypothetical protein
MFLPLLVPFALLGCETYRPLAPSVQESPRTGLVLKEPVLLGLFDGRADKKDSAQLLNSLRTGIETAYGRSVQFVDYFASAPANRVLVRIRINELGSRFGSRVIPISTISTQFGVATARAGTWGPVVARADWSQTTLGSGFSAEGWWVGSAWFELGVVDQTGARSLNLQLPLVAESRESNTLGYASASAAANKAWSTVSAQLFSILDALLLKVRDEQSGESISDSRSGSHATRPALLPSPGLSCRYSGRREDGFQARVTRASQLNQELL